jgi:hypothetical protein
VRAQLAGSGCRRFGPSGSPLVFRGRTGGRARSDLPERRGAEAAERPGGMNLTGGCGISAASAIFAGGRNAEQTPNRFFLLGHAGETSRREGGMVPAWGLTCAARAAGLPARLRLTPRRICADQGRAPVLLICAAKAAGLFFASERRGHRTEMGRDRQRFDGSARSLPERPRASKRSDASRAAAERSLRSVAAVRQGRPSRSRRVDEVVLFLRLCPQGGGERSGLLERSE